MAIAPFTDAPGAGGTGKRWTRLGLTTVALCFAINMADGVDVTILSFIAPRLQQDWGIGANVMGSLFSAGLLGMALGGTLIAPSADRFGRRNLILVALCLMSTGMLASSQAQTVSQLFMLRVVVGAGIGTVLAAMAALAAESVPDEHRGVAVGIVQAGYPFAAVFTGVIVAHLLPVYGWAAMLLAAGLITLALLPIAWLILPTDARPKAAAGGVSPIRIAALFSPVYRAQTIALWCAVFFGLMVLYFIVSWIPKLAIQAGLSETDGIYAGALYNLGAFVGTMAMSFLVVRVRLGRLVPAMLVLAGSAMLVFGSIKMSVPTTLLLAFLIGLFLQGGYNGIFPLMAFVYPADRRATGVGWAIGIGRIGAIVGPMFGGYLIAVNASLPLLFGAYCIPLLLCAGCVFLVDRLHVTRG
jgi:MFS family permease